MRKFEKYVLTFEDLAEVTLAVLGYHIDGIEGLEVLGGDDLDDSNQVRVVKLSQNDDFAEDALGIDLVVKESGDLFYRYLRWFPSVPSHPSL